MFSSELKALKIHPDFKGQVNRDALCLLMRHNCIPSPYSIYQGIAKLDPGCLLTLSVHQREPIVKAFWSSAEKARQNLSTAFSGSADDAVDELDGLLKQAVGQQMIADVPLGAFLSGGIDSSTIVALMQAQSSQPIKTFSIGTYDNTYNEADHAKAVAKHLGTDHTELYVSSEEALAVIPKLPMLYDEPFSDSSQIPTFLVSQLAKQHVKVSLTGDAGDELFLGYNRYALTASLWGKLSIFPVPIRQVIAKSLVALSPQKWNDFAQLLNGKFPYSGQLANLGDKLHKAANVIPCGSVEDVYKGLCSHWRNPAEMVIGATEPSTLLTTNIPNMEGLNNVERMAVLDTLTYLPDDILCKVDRAAMGVSLETRVPFLDHRIAEFAWSLPAEYKLRDGQTKWPLRQVLYRYVPKDLIERPKMGFGVPIDNWLRGPLREWAEELLDESHLRQQGYFSPKPIREKWQEHLSGKRNWQHHLWDVLMFNAWLEKN